MPSFAKANVHDESSNPLNSIWKDKADFVVVDDLILKHRTRAVQILKEDIPAKITHLQTLIAQEDDPSSLLWLGHVNQGDFLHPLIFQPTHDCVVSARDLGFLKETEYVLQPEQVVLADNEKEALGADQALGEFSELNAKVRARTRVACSGPDRVREADKNGGVKPGTNGREDERSVSALGDANGNGSVNGNGRGNGRATARVGEEVSEQVTNRLVGPHYFEVVPTNKVQTELVEMCAKEYRDLHRLCTELRLWLELEIPLIEDDNSFGAEVQNHLIRELDAAWKRCNGFLNGGRQHHTDRIKLVSDWIKYPNVMDIPAAIANSDQFDHFLNGSYLCQTLTIYAGLITKFARNWEKVVNPKGMGGVTSGGMY